MARVLVVGGAGYVGSTVCAWLMDAGHDFWVLDDLSTGHKDLVLSHGFTFGKAGDFALVQALLREQKFDCVMHFAAKSLVGQSVLYPQEYFENNVVQTRRLLDAVCQAGVKNFIFSSTCAIFGNPGNFGNSGNSGSLGNSSNGFSNIFIDEQTATQPLNPYGETKLEVEKLLQNYSQEKGLNAISLRYFNAAGAEPRLRVGEWHEDETHLIPRVLQAAFNHGTVPIFGADYPTPDGTCIRDYVHVWNLAAAHASAMQRLIDRSKHRPEGVFEAYNLGSEKGYSVLEIIRACEEILGKKLDLSFQARRAGDPPRLVAGSSLARKVLGWGKESGGALRDILVSALAWEQKRMTLKRPAVFLDRDGTINEDPGYLSDPEQMKLLPEVGEALALLKEAGYLLVVVSNQSGVGRGLIDPRVLPVIHKRLEDLLSPFCAKIDRYELCIHHPNEECECRKPKAKLLLDAAEALNIDLSASYMVGDKVSDVLAGRAAGCKASILVRTGDGLRSEKQLEPGHASFVGDSLMHAAKWVLGRSR